MKKTWFVSALLFAWAALSPGAQEEVTDTGAGRCFMSGIDLLNTRQYGEYFGFKNGLVDPASEYVFSAPRAERRSFSNLAGNDVQIDTPLEFSLLSYYSQPVLNIRPVESHPEIDAILPKNDPRLSDLKLGAAVYMDMQAAKFLGSDPAPYAAALKFITDRGRVTEANIKDFVKQGIAAAVDAEFNKVSFMMNNDAIRKGYSVTLTRTTNNQYILEYESIYQGKDFYAKLPPASLETLLATMRGDTANFDKKCVDTVRDNAALIPAVIFDGWKKTTPNMVNPYELLTKALTDFYVTPNNANYQIVRGIVARTVLATITDGDEFSTNMSGSIGTVLISFNQALNDKINGDLNTTNKIIAASGIPAEPQYGIFALNKRAGDEIFVSKTRRAPDLMR